MIWADRVGIGSFVLVLLAVFMLFVTVGLEVPAPAKPTAPAYDEKGNRLLTDEEVGLGRTDTLKDFRNAFAAGGGSWSGPKKSASLADVMETGARLGIKIALPLWIALRVIDFMFVGLRRRKAKDAP